MTRARAASAPLRRSARSAGPAAAAESRTPPYPPSWLNRLIEWIDRQPGPAWVYYAASALLLGILIWLTRRMAGEASPFAFTPQSLLYALYPGYMVGLVHYLDRQAISALDAFRPALGASDADFARIRYDLTTIPAAGAWIVSALAVPLAYLFVVAPQPGDLSPQVVPAEVLGLAVTAFVTATFLVLALHTIRQLRKVSELHDVAMNINLLQPRPTYAFSRLTSRTAMGVLLFLYFDFVVNPPAPGASLPFFVLVGATVIVEAAAFLLPLLGMHQRLAREKARLEAEVNESVEATYQGFLAESRSGTFDRLNELDKALSGLLRMRDLIARLSTWPWQPETLRGMVGAILLPIALWLIQRLLGSLLA